MRNTNAISRKATNVLLCAAMASFATLFAPAAMADQIYATQGYVDYAIAGSGFRLQNASVTGTCGLTGEAAYWAASRTFNVAIPATATGIDRAYLVWGGSSDVADATATLSINGGAGVNVTGTTKTGSSPPTVRRYYESLSDVTAQVSAGFAGPGNMSVTVSNVTFKAQLPDNWRGACTAAGAATLVVVYTTDLNNATVDPRAVVIDDMTVGLFGDDPGVGAGPAIYTGNITGVAAAATTSNGRMSIATIEGDAALPNAESFSLTIGGTTTSYDAFVNWDSGDKNIDATLNGGSWELDQVNAPTLIIPGGTTAVTYTIQSGTDWVLPSVMALSWAVRADFGDAPASYGIARHSPADLGDGATRLGAGIDFEGSALNTADANGDDANGTDDESGVASLPLLSVATTSYTATTSCSGGSDAGVNQTGQVSAWIDFNRDGVFDNPSERAQTTCPPGASSATLTWVVAPTQIVAGPTFMRVRIGRLAAQVANPTGNAVSGEVEDYKLDIVPTIAVNKQVWPDVDTGVFNFAIGATIIGANLGDDQSATPRTLYHKQINDYNGMAGIAPSVTVPLDVSINALVFTLTETGGTATNLADYTSAYTCVNGAGVTVASADPSTSASLTIPLSVTGAAPNGRQQNITCAFVNQTARITIVKNTLLGDGTFAFAATGNKVENFNITTAAGTGTATINLQRIFPDPAGSTETVTETVPAGWRLDSIACTFLAPDGSTGTVGTVANPAVTVPLTRGYDYTCTFVNHKLTAEVRLTKTNTPGVNGDADQAGDTLVSGATTSYSIVVSNNGPDSADGTVVTDPASGLTCPTATCTAAGGAVCPAATGAALVSALQGAGATVPTLPLGGTLTFVLSCQVP